MATMASTTDMHGSSKHAEDTATGRSDSRAVTKRLQSELMSFMMNTPPGISAFPDGDNLFTWSGTIDGVQGTVYEGQSYKVVLKFPANYPISAPTVTFDTPCFHPNVDQHGNICLDILKENWSAVYNVRTVLLSLQSLLGEPNVDSPLNAYAASLWEHQNAYKAELAQKYADATAKRN
eukprot:TRINITY_DN5049_c0_g1_i1.p1 TRINITY_DN5049_c0_g1~~TRINITY_DN5049_c0_g1_i1.p1  ORF type:complete len:195 (-),score=43.43 TRINITY_DN5049_c0_g1_i1:231-764(-)